MGRKTKIVAAPHFENCEDRDHKAKRQYLITEWSAAKADRWIQEVMLTANKGGGSLPIDMRGIGWEGIAVMGINTFLRGNIDKAEMIELGEQLLECVQIVRDPAHPTTSAGPLVGDDDIEEVATRWWLRDQVVSVHTNFSPAAALSKLISSILTPQSSSSTPTSPQG